MIESFLLASLSAFSWIKTVPSIILLGECPFPNESDYE